MSRSLSLPVLVVLLATAATAGDSWTSFREGRSRARAEHRPMVVFFDLEDANSALFLKQKFSDPRIQKLKSRFVLVRATQGARDVWSRYEVLSGPAVVFTDSDGKLLERGDWRSADGTYYAMKAALRKFGPVISPEAKAKADALTAEIKLALKKKDYAAAVVAARKLAALTTENPYAERARITFKRLGEMAQRHLDRAAAHEKAGRYYDALVQCETVIATFPGIPQAKDAEKRIARFGKSRIITETIARQRDEANAKAALAAANAKDAKRPDLALEKWETLAARWPDTEAGREAKRLALFRRGDPEAMKQVRESRAKASCPGKLAMAKSYRDAGKPDLARAILEKLIDEHAGTSFEKPARELLATLK